MHKNEGQHFPQVEAHLHTGQMLALGASTRARVLVHEVEKAYLLIWNVTNISYENDAKWWQGKLDRKESSGALVVHLLARRALFWRKSSC